jgi:hypothetical protein
MVISQQEGPYTRSTEWLEIFKLFSFSVDLRSMDEGHDGHHHEMAVQDSVTAAWARGHHYANTIEGFFVGQKRKHRRANSSRL